jgi:response regulator RpfG family c-di-GMP phosphodiesterase
MSSSFTSNASKNTSNSKRILLVDDEADVISLFMMVLEMNGFELYKKMKNIDGSLKACFITAFEDYRQEFKESFPELDEIKCFIRKPKAIEDLVNHVATILG